MNWTAYRGIALRLVVQGRVRMARASERGYWVFEGELPALPVGSIRQALHALWEGDVVTLTADGRVEVTELGQRYVRDWAAMSRIEETDSRR